MVEDTKDLFREHCENREELEEFYDEISGYKNALVQSQICSK